MNTINRYQLEAQSEIRWHKMMYAGTMVIRSSSLFLQSIIESIDSYEESYLQEFDRDILIEEIKKQLNINK